jgi:hypothetical protein
VEKWKIATVGGAIFPPYSIRIFLFFRSTENGGKPWWIFTPTLKLHHKLCSNICSEQQQASSLKYKQLNKIISNLR